MNLSTHLAHHKPLDLRANAVAGLVVGIIAIPLSIALAVAVGVSPVTGLYTAIIAGAIAAIFGGSSYNITGPTAALVPVLHHAVLRHGPEALPTLALLTGVLLIVMARLRAGRLVRYIPGTVVVGFTAGIALSIAFGQLGNLLALSGTDPRLEHFHERLLDNVRHLGTMGPEAPLVGLTALAILIAWPRVPRLSVVPGPLIAIVVTTAITWGLGVDVPTITSAYGPLPRDLPHPALGAFDPGLIAALFPLALSVAVLAGIESLLSAVVADGMAPAPVRHAPDRELFGQGLGNAVNSVFGGIPATAAIARTAAGIRNGGTNRLTGVFHALTVLAATLLFSDLAGHIPLTALAAILLVVAWKIAEVPEISRLVRKAPREDAAIVAATMLITLLFDLTYAIGFGVLASAVLLLRRMVQVPAARKLLPDAMGQIRQVSPELAALISSHPDIAVFSCEGLLSFHSAAAFEYELLGHGNQPLILRMKDVHHVDTTGLLTLEGIIEHRHRHGGRLMLTAVQPEIAPMLEKFGLFELAGRENIFLHTRCAIAALDAPPPVSQTAVAPDDVDLEAAAAHGTTPLVEAPA